MGVCDVGLGSSLKEGFVFHFFIYHKENGSRFVHFLVSLPLSSLSMNTGDPAVVSFIMEELEST